MSVISSAVTAKGVPTASDADKNTIATNIAAIPVGVDTSDATATANKILSGYTAYAKGSKIIGTMELAYIQYTLNIYYSGGYTCTAYVVAEFSNTINTSPVTSITSTTGDERGTHGYASGTYLNKIFSIDLQVSNHTNTYITFTLGDITIYNGTHVECKSTPTQLVGSMQM